MPGYLNDVYSASDPTLGSSGWGLATSSAFSTGGRFEFGLTVFKGELWAVGGNGCPTAAHEVRDHFIWGPRPSTASKGNALRCLGRNFTQL